MAYRVTSVSGTVEVPEVFISPAPAPAWTKPRALRAARNNKIAVLDRRIASLRKVGTPEALLKIMDLQQKKDQL